MTTVLKALICLDVLVLSAAFLAVALYLCRYLRLRIDSETPAPKTTEEAAPPVTVATGAEKPAKKVKPVKPVKPAKPAGESTEAADPAPSEGSSVEPAEK
jgi:hypothetical protein